MIVQKVNLSTIKKELKEYAKKLNNKCITKDVYKYIEKIYRPSSIDNTFKTNGLYIESDVAETDCLAFEYLRFYSKNNNLYLIVYVGNNVGIDFFNKLKQYKGLSENLYILPNSHINKNKISIFAVSYSDKYKNIYDIDFAINL